MKKTFIAVAAVLGLILVLPGHAAALTPPQVVSGEVVFSNAGRIVSINADGSNRSVLTRKAAPVATRNYGRNLLDMGDEDPSISPDGQQIAFIRSFERDGEFIVKLMVGARDGTSLKSILSFRNSFLSSVDWSPDGYLVASMLAPMGTDEQGRESYQRRLIRLDSDGSNRRPLLAGKPGDFLGTPWLQAQGVSPDGSTLLYTRATFKQTELRTMVLETGENRRVAFGVSQAAYSPDGGRIVFTAEPCFRSNPKNCDPVKWLDPGLWTMASDGGDLTALSRDRSATYPSYSPDGRRIVFASRRNVPGRSDSANEIYSMTPAGKCLTWITNGSPASGSPSWGPEVNAEYSAGGCGSVGRKPLVEVAPLPAREKDPRPRMWAGPRVGSRLLSSLAGYWPGSRSELYVYGDCAYFNPAECSQPLTLESASLCRGFDELQFGDRHRLLRKRGTTVGRTWERNGIGGTAVRIGRAAFGIGETLLTRGPGKPNTFADHLKVISLLRPVGKPQITGSKLPAPIKVRCGKRR